jgi:hypothetical protein
LASFGSREKSIGRRKRLPHKDGSPSAARWDRRFRLSIRHWARFSPRRNRMKRVDYKRSLRNWLRLVIFISGLESLAPGRTVVEVLPAQRFSRDRRASTPWQPGHPIAERAGAVAGRQGFPEGVPGLGNQAEGTPIMFQPEPRTRTAPRKSSPCGRQKSGVKKVRKPDFACAARHHRRV